MHVLFVSFKNYKTGHASWIFRYALNSLNLWKEKFKLEHSRLLCINRYHKTGHESRNNIFLRAILTPTYLLFLQTKHQLLPHICPAACSPTIQTKTTKQPPIARPKLLEQAWCCYWKQFRKKKKVKKRVMRRHWIGTRDRRLCHFRAMTCFVALWTNKKWK